MTSSTAIDYWQVLGLDPGADAASLKRAFRLQARRWHPDLNGNDPVAEDRFKLVNEAYAVLSDPRRRKAWELGEEPFEAEEPSRESVPFASGFPSFEDYLDALFGARRRPADREEPPAAEEEPLQDSGPRGWDGPARQPRGEVTTSEVPPPPVVAGEHEETDVDLSPEQALHGERIELRLRDGTEVELWTPAMAGDGWRLRLAGVAPGGGDHFLRLRVRTPEGLRIDGLRVIYQLELSPAQAALGSHLVVPTLEGPVRLRVPPASSSGRLLRLRGRGLRLGETVGDQIVELRITLPERLSEAEEALYRRLGELERDAGE